MFRRLSLLAGLLLAGPALAQMAPPPVSAGTGAIVSGGQVSVTYGTTAGTAAQGNDVRIPHTGVTQRAPRASDDSVHGYTVGDVWQYRGTVWVAASVSPRAAVWVPTFVGPNADGGLRIAPAPLPVDVLGASAVFACGTTALKSAYTGAAIDVTITVASSPSTKTVNILANGTLDVATLNAWIATADAGTVAHVVKCWDQTGNGRHAVTANGVQGPVIGYRTVSGIPALSWGNALGEAGLQIPSSVSLSRNSLGIYEIGQADSAAGAGSAVFEVGNSITGPSLSLIGGLSWDNTSQAALNVWAQGGSGGTFANVLMPTAPQVLSLLSGASSLIVGVNEKSASQAAMSNMTVTGGYLGDFRRLAYKGMFSMIGVVVANAVPSSGIHTAVLRGAYGRFGIAPQTRPVNVVFIGDSRTQGYYSDAGANYVTQVEALLRDIRPDVGVVNVGYGGQTASVIASNTAPVVAGHYVAGTRNIAWLGPIGTNDIAGATAPATVFANIQSAVATLKAAGFTVVLSNEFPRTDGYASAMTTLRGLIASGTSGADLVVDPITMPQLADPTNTTYFADGLHETTLGYAVYAAFAASVLAPYLQ